MIDVLGPAVRNWQEAASSSHKLEAAYETENSRQPEVVGCYELLCELAMRIEKLSYMPVVAAGICLVGSQLYPVHATTIWIVGMGSLLPLLWHEVKRPVNYFSLEFDAGGFVFQRSPDERTSAGWAEVMDVFYCRTFNDFANQIDTEWHFLLSNGKLLEVLVEWPHRAKFAKALIQHLEGVSPEAVERVTRERKEGRWSVVRGQLQA